MIGGREEDGGGFELLDEEMLRSGGGRPASGRDDIIDMTEAAENAPLNEEVLRSGGTRGDVWPGAAGMLVIGESSEGPTRSSAPSSSALTILSICVAV